MRRAIAPPTFAELARIPHDGEFAAWALERWGADALMNPVIAECGHHDEGRVGLGDLVKAITNRLGFETCSACEARRRRLNRWSVRRLRRKPKKICPVCGGLRA